ncbi:hypothetical protein V474_22945 [Novosphingobium barchaimii LL02]|uniref:Uncharacterized protein n=1 Tax=Novosphingobium barchaimii LL02 TaxID=1114963 RepID=A0A0J7XNV1_9SPHN|nr:hypothetical protein [Novosphingobium barchaimii]KMS53626.1 hypothetical protein V474_22945 [Novosphingobium barchaimii LL02]
MFFLYALTLTSTLQHPDTANADPAGVSEADAINCRLDVPGYMPFAMAINGEEKLAQKRRWKRVVSRNALMNEYELPQPITVAGTYSTRRIAFTSDAILAILDLPDPATVARAEQVDNAMSADPMIDALLATDKTRAQAEGAVPFHKFLGERIVKDVTEPAEKDESYGSHMVVARTISNATTHPGKTFYGCSYRFEMLDKDGAPL